MVELPDLSTPYVLHQIMVSIDPYQLLPLYLPSVLEEYKYQRGRADQNALPPHIYDIARECYNNIIVISGESGSGKTECAGNDNKIEQKLLSTNPILESFGNCRTVRNNQ